MITIQGNADCIRCGNNPEVYQPTTNNETEWICCDKYKIVPTSIITGEARCDEFKESAGMIITE
jgi:hypothetical protein